MPPSTPDLAADWVGGRDATGGLLAGCSPALQSVRSAQVTQSQAGYPPPSPPPRVEDRRAWAGRRGAPERHARDGGAMAEGVLALGRLLPGDRT
eukprot:gene19058-biopygen25033